MSLKMKHTDFSDMVYWWEFIWTEQYVTYWTLQICKSVFLYV